VGTRKKPSPKGEGWVRGNQKILLNKTALKNNKASKAINLNSPHPTLPNKGGLKSLLHWEAIQI